jgi:hypothetical protein
MSLAREAAGGVAWNAAYTPITCEIRGETTSTVTGQASLCDLVRYHAQLSRRALLRSYHVWIWERLQWLTHDLPGDSVYATSEV